MASKNCKWAVMCLTVIVKRVECSLCPVTIDIRGLISLSFSACPCTAYTACKWAAMHFEHICASAGVQVLVLKSQQAVCSVTSHNCYVSRYTITTLDTAAIGQIGSINVVNIWACWHYPFQTCHVQTAFCRPGLVSRQFVLCLMCTTEIVDLVWRCAHCKLAANIYQP